MAEIEPSRPDKALYDGKGKHEAQTPHPGKHIDTGEHLKKDRTDSAPVADDGLGMSKLEITRKG